MCIVIRDKSWLLLLPLVMLGSHLAVQAQRPPQSEEPPAKEPEDLPALKLPALLAAKPLKEDRKDDEMRKLLKARYNEALGEMRYLYELYRRGANFRHEAVTARTLFTAAPRLVQAGLEVFDQHEDKVTLLTRYVELAREAEKITEGMHRAGAPGGTVVDFHYARYQRLDAEIQLLRCKREAGKGKDK